MQTCMPVETGRHRLLLDCGATSQRRQGVDPAGVEAVLVSHLHGDHFGGLPFFLLDAQFRRGERPLVVAGPPGIASRVREAMEALFPGSSGVRPIKYHLDYATLAGHRARLGCRRLILTHMSEEMLARVDGLEVEAARDGFSTDV